MSQEQDVDALRNRRQASASSLDAPAMIGERERWRAGEAESFVRDIFNHVLRLTGPAYEAQVASWTRRAKALGDPVTLFRALIELPQHRQRMEAERDANTRWLPGHFYSPCVSRAEATKDQKRIFANRPLIGVDLRETAQLELLEKLAPHFATIPFPEDKEEKHRYNYHNPSYGYGDAIIYWSMLQHFRPNRIIEVGSGYSSALALDAIDILHLPTVCTFIDPFPEVAIKATAPLRPPHTILPSRVQDFDPEIVTELGENDLLFIDSSHVLKTGSDVHFELTELLPRLRPGVLVHFHDVFDNFEYPAKWVLDLNHGWNELYALHVFLMYNSSFRIEYFNQLVAKRHPEVFSRLAPRERQRILLNPGGGLWLRRI
ncbi:MAG: hypothetical protein C5B44_06895 [Acidobacteria bacterium]|nr:MAG: hypothetical protein C5B44_06895 [Acidobacteriota bacterium]